MSLSPEQLQALREGKHGPINTLVLIDHIDTLTRERDEARAALYVPGAFRCKKCGFFLSQFKLRASDGAIGSRDEPGEHCPNDGSPLWRVTWEELAGDHYQRAADELAHVARLTEVMDGVDDDEALADAIHAELKRQQAFSIEHHGKIALAEGPIIRLVIEAVRARAALAQQEG